MVIIERWLYTEKAPLRCVFGVNFMSIHLYTKNRKPPSFLVTFLSFPWTVKGWLVCASRPFFIYKFILMGVITGKRNRIYRTLRRKTTRLIRNFVEDLDARQWIGVALLFWVLAKVTTSFSCCDISPEVLQEALLQAILDVAVCLLLGKP